MGRRPKPKPVPAQEASASVRPKASKVEKSNKRKALIEGMMDRGEISATAADELARKVKVKLSPDKSINAEDGILLGRQADVGEKSELVDSFGNNYSSEFFNVTEYVPSLMSHAEKVRFLQLISTGLNSAAVCSHMKIDIRRFRKTLREDSNFYYEFKREVEAPQGYCMSKIYEMAMLGDVDSCAKFIQIRNNATSSNFSRNLAQREIRLKERIVEAQIGPQASASITKPNFSVLDEDEFNQYTLIHDKIKLGEDLSDQEHLIYGKLTAKLARGKVQADPMQGQLADILNSKTNVRAVQDKMSEIEND
jgi:hypothetical protein